MLKPVLKTKTMSLSKEYYYVEFRLLEPLEKPPIPFQFINIWIPGVDEIPLSISTFRGNEIGVLFRVIGEGTRSLRDKTGFFGFKGPLGRGLELGDDVDRVLFVAGGIGIAPLPYFTEYASRRGVLVDVVWGVRESSMLFELSELTKYTGDIYVSTEDCHVGFCGDAVGLTHRLLRQGGRWDIVIATGPLQMLRYICKLRERGVDVDVYVSLETMIKCGYGICGSCVVKPYPRLLCVDGPVYSCREVEGFL